MDLAITVESTTFQLGLLDQSDQSFVLLLSWRCRLFQPRVEATSVNPQSLAQGNDTVLVESGGHERVPFLDSLAKYAAASFKMLRSSVTWRSSAFRRRISACKADSSSSW